jgi:hypothetical protein
MNSTELTEIVRSYIKDEVSPYLWSDAEILRYLRKAEREMCEKTHVLIDAAITFDATAGLPPTYELDSNVLRVYAVRVAANYRPLDRLRGQAYNMQYQDTTGEPTTWSTFLGDRLITLYPAPDETYAMEAICAVMPATPIGPTTDSSIPEEHQDELANYAAYRCLATNDVDGEQVGTAAVYEDLWGVYLRDLKREIYRYRTGDKLVLVNWTGARNGGASNISVGQA